MPRSPTSAPAARRSSSRGYEPERQSGNPLQTIVLGVLLGIVLGVGLALLREQADRRLHRAEQVSAAFDAPVLTTVPRAAAR